MIPAPPSLRPAGRPIERRDLRLRRRQRRIRVVAVMLAALLGGTIGLLFCFP
jgi:hypothetical protein